jgi:hypothetical protein
MRTFEGLAMDLRTNGAAPHQTSAPRSCYARRSEDEVDETIDLLQ